MYTKTLAAVLVIATAQASRLTARAGGRGDVSTTATTASDDASASASASSDATAAATAAGLSIIPPHWWPTTCDVRKTFSVNAPKLWYAASVPDLMDCT